MKKQQIIIETQGGEVTNVFGDNIEFIVVNNDTDDPIDWENPIQADPRNAFLLDEVPEQVSHK
jgi:hypothetical protein